MAFKKIGELLFPSAIAEEDYGYGNEIEDGADFEETEERNVRPADNGFAPRGTSIGSTGSSIEMKVVSPKSYDTVTQIADLLLSKKTVLLNLENTNRETARRLIDFLSGVAYALGGGVQKVADNTYAITPSNVAVSKGDFGTAAPAAEAEDSQMF